MTDGLRIAHLGIAPQWAILRWAILRVITNYALEKERVGKYFDLTLCTECYYLVHRNTFLN